MLELVGFHAAIAQLVERIHGKDEVTSSSLVDGSILGLSANWHVITLAFGNGQNFALNRHSS